MKKKQFAFFQSVVCLVLCLSMFVSTTFAWFTDAAVSGGNIIASGVLDATMEYATDPNGQWTDASTGAVFNYEFWEPGYTDMKFIRVGNNGNLAFRYQLHIIPTDPAIEGEPNLADVIDVYCGVVEDGFVVPTDFSENMPGMTKIGTLSDLIGKADGAANGILLPTDGADRVTLNPADEPIAKTGSSVLCIMLHMQEDAGNEYQNLTVGGTFRVQLNATQYTYENDSFGNDYDTDSEFPIPDNDISENTTVDVTVEDNKVKDNVTIQGSNASAQVPSGVQVSEGTDKLTLSISEKEESESNITLGENEAMRALDVHVEGVAENNTQPMEIYIKGAAPKGLNAGNLKLYHVENGVSNAMTEVDTFTAHNQFKYDPATGDVTLYMATFSEITLLADTVNPWNGEVDHTWYTTLTIANADQLWSFSQIVGGMAEGIAQDSFSGKTVKLTSDVNLGYGVADHTYTIFYPIGYNSSDGKYEKTGVAVTTGFYTFEGTFDGQGHTISNFYQSTWEMKGDNEYYAAADQHYRDGMGLFGKVYGGTVKNLTVANFSSDGEYTTTGVIAAYADSANGKSATFENIAIVNCNPRVYNIGNGGIVGCGGWYSREATDVAGKSIIFKNITVDKTNKISALWGSYDVACGGIMGQYYPNSGCGVSFENCHVAGQIDVYNDVCGNYQYYAYRYAGMMIGSIRENETIDGHVYPKMDGITAKGCTVHFDTWNDYFYCELVDNTQASYTHDHQMSRLTKVDSVDVNNKTVTVDGATTAIPTSGWANYVVVNGEFATEHATCYHFKDGNVWNHEDAGTQDGVDEDGDGQDDLKEDKQHIYLPFSQLFTGYGWGVTSKGLTDYNGIKTMDITHSDQNASVVKFATKFENAGTYLYRVGNMNDVALGTLFKEAAGINPEDISDSGVYVTITDIYNELKTMGTFTANTSDWTKGTIKFAGTGPVKVTIQDYDYCTPTELYLEVIDAKNLTSAAGSTDVDVVLLSDVQIGTGGVAYYTNCTVYGNGFEYKVVGGVNTSVTNPTSGKKTNYFGIINLANATLDNTVVVGEVYDKYGVFVDNEDVTAAVFASGGSIIQDCYISNCSAPVRSNGATIINTTLYGGTVGNLILNSDTTVLEDVTTVNYNDGREVNGNLIIGGGILVGPEAADNTTLVINGNFVQNNFVSKTDASKIYDSNAKALFDEMFTSKYSAYQFTYSGDAWVNTGIVSMTDTFDESDISGTAKDEMGYTGRACSFAVDASGMSVSYSGYVYTLTADGHTVNNSGNATTDPTQGQYLPTFELDLGEYYDSNEGESDTRYCYESVEEEEIRLLYQDGEDPFEIDLTKLAKVTKFGVPLVVKNAVCKNASGTVLATNSVVTLKDAGIYTFEFTAEDDLIFDADGMQTGETVDITYVINVDLAVKKASWKNAEITLSTPSEKSGYTSSKNYSLDFLPAISITDYKEDGTSETVSIKDLYSSYSITYVDSATPSAWSGFSLTITLTDGRILTVTFGKPTGLSSPGPTAGGKTFTLKSDDGYGYYLQSDGTIKTKTTGTWPITGCTFKGNNTVTVEKTQTANLTVDQNTQIPKSCVTSDTLITLANGTQKRIDQVTYSDILLVWDFFKGEYAVVPAALIVNHGYGDQTIIKLTFDDGTVVKAITAHSFFDVNTGKWELINAGNANEYIGHAFVQADGDGYTTAKLVDVEVYEEYAESYSLVSAYHYNFITENMFSLTNSVHNMLAGLVVGENMTYELESDIAACGLYTYDDFADYITYEQYVAFNGDYLKISVEKGYITYDEILTLINEYL